MSNELNNRFDFSKYGLTIEATFAPFSTLPEEFSANVCWRFVVKCYSKPVFEGVVNDEINHSLPLLSSLIASEIGAYIDADTGEWIDFEPNWYLITRDLAELICQSDLLFFWIEHDTETFRSSCNYQDRYTENKCNSRRKSLISILSILGPARFVELVEEVAHAFGRKNPFRNIDKELLK